MDSNSESIGIFQRLVKFVLGIISRPTEPHHSSEVPIEEGSSRNGKTSIKPTNKPNGFSGSEIVVEFRHIDGSERWTQIDQTGSSIRAPEKDGPIQAQGNGLQGSRANGQKKNVTFKQSDSHLGNEEIKVNNEQPREEKKTRPPRRLGPLLSVASNINEKAETFIQSRKKAMNRNYSLDQHEKS